MVDVPEKIGVNTMRELIKYAKKNPVNMGSYAPGSYPQMVADQTNRREGTKIVTINYRGESPMWVDVAGGQLQVAIGSYQLPVICHRAATRREGHWRHGLLPLAQIT